ncbi:MAG: hypothetical protein WBG50_11670 [Desulfomonilaceae bacterium]
MSQSKKHMVEISQLEIVVAAENHNPTILNPDFLVRNKIVPDTWKLAQPPICIQPLAQVSYDNGVSITADPAKVVFSEMFREGIVGQPSAPGIAMKYVSKLPHVDYRAVGINPTGHVVLDSDDDAPRSYLMSTLISDGHWRNYGNAPVDVSLNFVFTLQDCRCSIAIERALKVETEGSRRPVLKFAANFHREVSHIPMGERVANLRKIVKNWKSDMENYINIVNDVFLMGKRGIR